ncbi:PREDICTED: mediator of RNA polymerase II transcription subunit 17-like isoform X2 [Priapulus caudatus]|uniref:Mediator of RNA polymerase II transcription subunit 17 n=1 Tax=Priapulus caudatus TaxID=37621 RepID=A0ABM1ESX9_PRICU|nr:PREDICTED: mediator of RNA polymerase II transcription subunit 17-like isoform X2 [Priapulus caudatus]
MNAKMATSVDVSLEALAENQIQEISLDGHEIYVQPISMSESLTKLAQRIDFTKMEEEGKELKSVAANETEEGDDEAKSAFKQETWPWDSVHTKLRHSLTEASVLLDVLNIAKEKRYMLLDPIQQEPPESRMFTQVLGKKKALNNAAQILQHGSERLRKSDNLYHSSAPAFQMELLNVRRNWRLKKVANSILGDLSYKSAGSRFRQNGTFEVLENKEMEEGAGGHDTTPGSAGQQHAGRRSSLHVAIPSHLQGASYIYVSIQKDTDSLASANLTIPSHPTDPLAGETHWQKKLEAAQNVLFCKELFSQLAREAVQLKPPIPHMVIGNQITATLFPGIQLFIGLCHSNDQDRSTEPQQQQQQQQRQKSEHNHILEHSLHQLLREMHTANISLPMPHPSTAMLGASKRRRLAGPHAFSRASLLQLIEGSTNVLDSIAMQCRDPQIVIHWNALSDATHAAMKLNITSQGYETICRTSLAIHIHTTSVRVIYRDGRIVKLSHEPHELTNVLLGVVSVHNISALQSLSKLMSWQILSTCMNLGVGEVEALGNASAVVMASPSGERVLAIKSGPISGVRVYVQGLPGNTSSDASTLETR